MSRQHWLRNVHANCGSIREQREQQITTAHLHPCILIRIMPALAHRRLNNALERGPVLYAACTLEGGQRLWRWCARHAQNLAQLVRVEVDVGDIRIWDPKLNAQLSLKCDCSTQHLKHDAADGPQVNFVIESLAS